MSQDIERFTVSDALFKVEKNTSSGGGGAYYILATGDAPLDGVALF